MVRTTIEHRASGWFSDALLRLVSGFVGSRGIDQGVIHSEDSMLRVKEWMKGHCSVNGAPFSDSRR